MADSTASRQQRCPFCGALLLPEQELNEDHIFGKALGGRVVVTAHKACNEQSGSAAEAALQRPDSMINLLKAGRGLGGPPIPGEFPSGRRADMNRDGSVYSPLTFEKADDGAALKIEGKPAEVEKAFNAWRDRNPQLNIPEFKDLPPEFVNSVSYDKVNVELLLSLADAEAVAVKSALGACTLAYGPEFPASDFAAALRAVLDDPVDPLRQVGHPLLDSLSAYIAVEAARAGISQARISTLPRLVPAAGEIVREMILVPQGQRTVLFAHYISMPIPPYGIMIDARLPALTPGIDPVLPVLLRDGGTREHLEVTDFTLVMLEPVINAAKVAVGDGTAQGGS